MEKEFKSFAGSRQKDWADAEYDKYYEQQGGQDVGCFLYPVFNTSWNDKVVEGQKEEYPDEGAERIGRESGKGFLKFCGTFPGQPVGERLKDIFQCPTGNNAVKSQDEDGGEYPHDTDDVPVCSRREYFVGFVGICFCTSADGEFGYHNRYSDEEYADEIDQ